MYRLRLGYAWLTMGKAMGELDLVERIRSQWAGTGREEGRAAGHSRGGQSAVGLGRVGLARGVTLGIGDDCAILRLPKGCELAVTTDFSLEGCHFRRDWHPPESVGHRTLARGLSDLAAMGARPMAAFLSLALPGEMLSTRDGRAWVERFFSGLRTLADRHSVPLAGGDTAESPCGRVLADIVLVGSVPAGRALCRAAGRAGDALYLTGELGGAAAELAAMQWRAAKKQPTRRGEAAKDGAGVPAAHPQLYPQPRVAVGMALVRRRLATAAIDLSDGLSTDLAHLCQESGVGAEIAVDALPIHPLARLARPLRARQTAAERALELALHGGEDYELLFAAPEAVRMPRSVVGLRITRIGRLVRGRRILLLDSAGGRTPLQAGGWEHFAKKH